MFHGGNGRGGEAENHKKTIITRSGSVIQFDDTEGKGSIYIADPSGNTWHMDGDGNISVHAPKNVNIIAGENITLSAGMNINASAGMNIIESAGQNMAITVAMMMKTNVGANHTLNVTGDSTEIIKGDFKSEAKDRTEIAKKNYSVQSSEDSVHVKASKEIQKHSGEKSKNS
jgi:type VI secretion system secreted protein VgrG